MSSSSKTKIIRTGPSALTLLGVAFVILKLCDVIAWSWWLVLAPFWIPLVFVGVLILFFFILYVATRLFP